MFSHEMAGIYDAAVSNIDYQAWADYMEKIFRQLDARPRHILELACGTGNITAPLSERGYQIIATDLSEAMLSVARKKLERRKNVSFLKLNAIDFSMERRFDVILSTFDSLNYILETEDFKRVLSNVHTHLRAGGIFAFDLNSEKALSQEYDGQTFVVEEEDLFSVNECEYDRDKELLSVRLTYFIREGELYRKYSEVHEERLYRHSDVIEWLREAGFQRVSAWECWTFDSVSEETLRIQYVAQK